MNDISNYSIILISDPEILAIPIQENNEPMIDLKEQNIIILGPSPEIPNNTDYTQMRKTVYDMLVAAQNLLPLELKFCLYEGYRSLSLQEKLFTDRYNKVKQAHPTYTREQVFIETIKLVSPVINLDGSANIPPHSTGAAVDVYLVDANGTPVDMGMHPKNWTEDLDGAFSITEATCISATAKKHRSIMSSALNKVGFVNYPTEYWHWSYGDRYWAYHKKQKHALYNRV